MIKVRGNTNEWKITKGTQLDMNLQKHLQHNYSSDKKMCNKRPMTEKKKNYRAIVNAKKNTTTKTKIKPKIKRYVTIEHDVWKRKHDHGTSTIYICIDAQVNINDSSIHSINHNFFMKFFISCSRDIYFHPLDSLFWSF